MNAQPELFSFAKPPEPKFRLFVGIFPDAAAGFQLREHQSDFPSKFGLKGKSRPPENLHVTLHHIGDYPEIPDSILTSARKVCERVAAEWNRFEVRFDQLTHFRGKPGNHPIILTNPQGNAELHSLHRHLVESLIFNRLAQAKDLTSVPHITLFYDSKEIQPQPVTPVEWSVGEIVLVRSHLGKSQYDPEGRWPLG